MPVYPTSDKFRPVDPVLDKIFAGLANAPSKFIADTVLPVIADGSSAKSGSENFSTGTIQRVSQDGLFGDLSLSNERNPGSTFNRSKGVQLDPLTYSTQYYGLESLVDLDEEARAQLGGRMGLKQLAMAPVVTTLKVEKEIRVAAFFQTAANWNDTVTLAGANQWDTATSDPIGDIDAGVEAVGAWGPDADTIIFDRESASSLRKNPIFLQFLGDQLNRQIVNDATIASLMMQHWGLKAIFAKARKKTSLDAPGDTTPTLANIWTDTVWIGALGGANAVPLGGGAIKVDGIAAGRVVESGWQMREYDAPERKSVVQQIDYSEVDVAILAELGYTIVDTTA